MDPLAGTPWSAPSTVEGFTRSEPNPVLMHYAAAVLESHPAGYAVDIGCGAGRNAVPMARLGWHVVGTDLSMPMVLAARSRMAAEQAAGSFVPLLAPMDCLPLAADAADLIVAHGIWNLAKSDDEFRRAVREAARIARPGAALFVFTFSRHTLPPHATPVPGQRHTFTQFSGQPQIFLNDGQLIDEMGAAGFVRDDRVPLTEYNRPAPGMLQARNGPVIYEAAFRFRP